MRMGVPFRLGCAVPVRARRLSVACGQLCAGWVRLRSDPCTVSVDGRGARITAAVRCGPGSAANPRLLLGSFRFLGPPCVGILAPKIFSPKAAVLVVLNLCIVM